MRPIILVTLLFFTSACFAQKRYVFLYKKDGERVLSKDSVDYIRVINGPNEAKMYQVTEYYKSGKPKAAWMSPNIEPATIVGTYIAFWPNGNKKESATYKQGKLNDDDSSFFNNGQLHSVISYTQSDSTLKNALIPYRTRAIKMCNDFTGKTLVVNGEGYYKDYDSTGVITEEGTVKNGQRIGEWKGSSPSAKMTYKEIYDSSGKLLSGTSVYPDGTHTYKERYISADFKGGVNEFYKYLGRTTRYPAAAREHNIQGKVILSFIVEKSGKLSGIKILQTVSDEIDAEAIRVVQASPDWTPGTAFGREVRQLYTLPLSFTLSNR